MYIGTFKSKLFAYRLQTSMCNAAVLHWCSH